jgi:hypothetical protein
MFWFKKKEKALNTVEQVSTETIHIHQWLIWKLGEDTTGQYAVLFCGDCGIRKQTYLINGQS